MPKTKKKKEDVYDKIFKYFTRWLFFITALIVTYGFIFREYNWSLLTTEIFVERMYYTGVYVGAVYALLKMGDFF